MLTIISLDEGAPFPSTSFLQAAFWSTFKSAFGWRSLAFGFRAEVPASDRVLEGRLRVMIRSLKGPLCFAYVAGAPAVECPEEQRGWFLIELARALRERLPRSCLFIRFEPPWLEYSEVEASEGNPSSVPAARPRSAAKRPLFSPPLVKSRTDVQPPDTVLLELGPDEGELLSAMKAKWRYNVRLAEKKGVQVESVGSEGLDEFYRLYQATARRDRISIHPRSYYERLFSVCAGASAGEAPDLRLWIARHDGEAIAAIITLFRGREAVYLYGASSDSKRSLMPAYALQWAAIRAAKASGCASYDFYGVPPDGDPGHPMAGLYKFKTGFGGRIAHYAGAWDFAYSPLGYGVWTLAESLRAWWFKTAVKRLPGGRTPG